MPLRVPAPERLAEVFAAADELWEERERERISEALKQ